MTAAKSEKLTKGDIWMSVSFLFVVLFFIGSGYISYLNTQTLQRDTDLVQQTHQVFIAYEDLVSTMKDAETGQRGFVITGLPSYLEPYNEAKDNLTERLAQLDQLVPRGTLQETRLSEIKANITEKMAELQQTIDLRRTTNGFDKAKAVILTDKGKTYMDALRAEIKQSEEEETQVRLHDMDEFMAAREKTTVSNVLSTVLGIILALAIAFMIRRAMANRQREQWLQSGQVGLSNAMFGEQRVEQLGQNILRFLSEYTDAQVGAFFGQEGDGFARISGYGVPEGAELLSNFRFGEGLLGQAAKDKKTFLVKDIPDGYLTVGSALGHGKPRNLVIIPAMADDRVNGVLEFGYLHELDELSIELFNRSTNSIGLALRTAYDRTRLQNLLEETQRQGEELQAQSEELKVSNEELEEQSRALRESQARLEQQQAELEQINSQLEEQTQILETQRDDLNKTRLELEAKAKDLERTSRFKSDFLANMSHELRTPLNSSLILAKLLADNRDGNLSDEQVKYAQTIQSAGNDLLALISDILDLSKIEAGHMEMDVERVSINQLLDNLGRTFEPVARQKELSFATEVDAEAPSTLQTDPLRLEQVLKNLLSNALKFTEAGEVRLLVKSAPQGKVAFLVKDTGIGISEEQHKMVFEAFRQADGTTNRKYGGTGLGLSISRELAHLLGGDIALESEPGVGSTFTLTVARQLTSNKAPSAQPRPTPMPPAPSYVPGQSLPIPADVDDDRERLSKGSKSILVVEDDESFARILYDLAHDYGFQCLIATSAESGIMLATQYLPNAVLLDVGLPDHSGLAVLDRLKHDGRTRHIPVHVVSANDYSHTALSLGAIGYMLKPVKHDELTRAFESLRARLTQPVRRVLVVEDDDTQRSSLRLLLGSPDVETVGVASAAECMEVLKSGTFDCMVLDLNLPDGSGFSLLETLSQNEGYAFPPVIVYTGKDLSSEEEQQLRKHSQSIIVKGAKSPERLLDEVTLFLHQVVAELPPEKQKLIEKAQHRDSDLEGRSILVVEDDVRNIFALSSILEPRGAKLEIARNGREAIEALEKKLSEGSKVDVVLMDIMMPEMDGLTAMREIRKRPEWRKLSIIALTAKAMETDQKQSIEAGANDYIAKPLDVEKLLSLIRVWMPR